MAMSGGGLFARAPAYAGGGMVPASNYGIGAGSGGFGPDDLANILYGVFGDAGSPYRSASKELDRYLPQAQSYQQPFYKAGVNAMGNLQDWLSKMQDPSQFINHLMNQYQASPYSQFLQQQAIRSGQNAASAAGLVGSTPFAQQLEQNAANISSADMNNWLQNVLGINTAYGAGQESMVNKGQTAANALSELMQNFMSAKSGLQFGEDYAGQQQEGGLFSGLSHLFL